MKCILAPIQGMTIALYRNHYSEIFGGIDAFYAPFIATTEKRKASKSLFKDLLPDVNNPNLNVVPQLLGNNGSDFRYYAEQIVDMGYSQINWNIGCPYPMVTKKKKGSGILPYPRIVRNFLEEVCKDKHYDLTVKMRLGLNDLDEGLLVMALLNDYPLSGVTIHGRTGIQKYTGHVDLSAFDELYKACQHEVTYNGDINSYEDYKKISTRFPSITNFMLGRGALRDPFLPASIAGKIIANDEKIHIIETFHNAVYNEYKSILSGDQHLIDRMKEFWFYTATYIDPSGRYMKKIKKTRTSGEYLSLVSQMLNAPNSWQDNTIE